jgi:NADH:ubiquinone reductase (H+-translocating)
LSVMKKKLVIVGGGFAGVRLIRALGRAASRLEITLVDRREEAVFLPLLPDVVAGKVSLDRLLFGLKDFCGRRGVEFINTAVAGFADPHTLLLSGGRRLSFDLLVLAAGAEPNFHGNRSAREIALTLAGKADAARLRKRLEEVLSRGPGHTFLVVGGGYTGVETASALVYAGRRAARSGTAPFTVRILELAPEILGNLPEGIAVPARREVKRLGIEVTLSARIGEIGDDRIEVNGEEIRDCTLIWSAGMKAVDLAGELDFPRDKQGRLEANDDLTLPGAGHIFALGDTACFTAGDRPLRMAVQFSWAEGIKTARNIRRILKGKRPRPYRPFDYGYLIPCASGKAWGLILGIRVSGRLGSFFHYFMCVLRTLSWRNRFLLVLELAGLKQVQRRRDG